MVAQAHRHGTVVAVATAIVRALLLARRTIRARLPAGLELGAMRRDELDVLVDWAAGEGWNPGLADADVAWRADPAGFVALRSAGGLVGGGCVVSYDGAWGFLGLQFALTGVLRASGNMVMTMMLTLVSQWVLQFPLAYVLSKHTALGAQGIWWAFPVTNVLIALITIGVYAKGDWKKKRLLDEEEVLAGKVTDEVLTGERPR